MTIIVVFVIGTSVGMTEITRKAFVGRNSFDDAKRWVAANYASSKYECRLA